MILKYDTPVEVTQNEYSYLMDALSTLIAGRIDNGKYYIKAWLEIKHCNKVLNELRNQ